jgi:hypothetical protein
MPIWEYVNRRHGQRSSNSIRAWIESKSLNNLNGHRQFLRALMPNGGR